MTLIGQGRRDIVERLVASFDAAVERQEPGFVSLEAAQGWGKTAVVQAFYAELAARQAKPPYWPASLVDASDRDPLRLRKRIYPTEVHVAAGATMPWMWWGLSCDRRHAGTLQQVLADDVTQLEQHHAALISLESQTARQREGVRDLLLSLGSFGASILVPSIGDLTSGVEAAKDLYGVAREARQSRDTRRRMPGGGVIDANDISRAPLVDRVTELLRLLTQGGLAFVVVVDDAHDADPSLVRLLEWIHGGSFKAPVLCVSTAWPERLSDTEPEGSFGHWLKTFEARSPGRCERVPLPPLEAPDLEELVRLHAPATPADVVAAFARRADGNPLVLEGLLRVPRVGRSIKEGGITLSGVEVDELPNTYEDILRARWEALPEEVREALCLCTLQGRQAVQELVLHTFDVVRPDAADAANAPLDQAVDPHAWIRRAGELLRFHEQYALEIAKDKTGGFFSGTEVTEARQAIAERITGWKADASHWSALAPDLQRALLTVHVALAREGVAPDLAAAADSAYQLGAAALEGGLYRDGRLLAEEAVRWQGEGRTHEDVLGDTTRAASEVLLGRSLFLLGDERAARRVFERATADLERAAASDHPDALEARSHLALTLAALGEPERARPLLEEVVPDLERVLGPDHDTTLDARTHLAVVHVALGDWRTGRAQLEAVLADRVRAFGRDDPDAIELRSLLAYVLHVSGHPERARTLLEDVLADARRRLGADHPHTLMTRRLLAEAMTDAGMLVEAREQQEQLVEETSRAMGSQHPNVVETRGELATTLREMGELRAALAIQETVVRDLESIRGADHLFTIWARQAMALTVSALGAPEQARAILEEVASDASRFLGPDHVFWLTVPVMLAAVLVELGDLERACEVQREWLARAERAFEEVRLTLPARTELATTLRRLGRVGEAEGVLERPVAEVERELGPAHPDVLAGRAAIAGVLLATGDPEAVTAYRDLAADAERALGPENAIALDAQESLVQCLHERGEVEEAESLSRGLVEECERALGSRSPRSHRARQALANALLSRGDVEGGRDELARAAAGLESVCGPVHAQTVAARTGLAEWAVAGGEPEGAAELLRSLISDQQAALGADAPASRPVRLSLGNALYWAGDLAAARQTFEGLLRDDEKAGREDADTFRAIGSLGGTLGALGEVDAGVAATRTSLEGLERLLGSADREALEARRELGVGLDQLGDVEAALATFRQALAEAELALGPDDDLTLALVADTGAAAYDAEQIHDASLLYERLTAARIRLLGEDHPLTCSARAILAVTLAKLERLAPDAPLLDEIVEDYELLRELEEPEAQEALQYVEAAIGHLSELGYLEVEHEEGPEGRAAVDDVEEAGKSGWWGRLFGRERSSTALHAEQIEAALRQVCESDGELTAAILSVPENGDLYIQFSGNARFMRCEASDPAEWGGPGLTDGQRQALTERGFVKEQNYRLEVSLPDLQAQEGGRHRDVPATGTAELAALLAGVMTEVFEVPLRAPLDLRLVD